jgi:tetratricopeptide (TPR) repeat protein
MPMPSPAPVAGVRAADLAAAHADVEAGRFARAIPLYERILLDDPHNLEALIHLGVSLAGIGRVEQGVAHLDRALAMDPDNLHALWSKGQTLFDIKGDYAASIPVWERIASLVPDSPDGVAARGYVFRARERLKGTQDAPPAKRSP